VEGWNNKVNSYFERPHPNIEKWPIGLSTKISRKLQTHENGIKFRGGKPNLTYQPKPLPQLKLPVIFFFTYLLMLPANGTIFPANETARKWDDTKEILHFTKLPRDVLVFTFLCLFLKFISVFLNLTSVKAVCGILTAIIFSVSFMPFC
jgi:hypothetical protein